MNKEKELLVQYTQRYPSLVQAAALIKKLLEQLLKDTDRIDMISARAKDPTRFMEKAARIDPQTNAARYTDPLSEIQDQVGSRVVVFYTDDVEPVRKKILDEFRHVEDRKQEDPDPRRFGYDSHHFVCLIPPDIRKKTNTPIDFIEIQVSTLFQHAWAEANHDLDYKPEDVLDYDTMKEIAFSAAQAWGADRLFSKLWKASKD